MKSRLHFFFARMSDTHVKTTSRLAQWRVDAFTSSPSVLSWRSDVFKIGKWFWRLVVEKDRNLVIKLSPSHISSVQEGPPIASFNVRVVWMLVSRKIFTHPEIMDKQLKCDEPFVWESDVPLMGRYIIEVEFLDLKTVSPNDGEYHSIWSDDFTQKNVNSKKLSSLAKMLSESIHTDITICTSNGSIGAHRSVLAASSRVFHSMFSHDLKEKEMSTINISDMSIEACKAFLNYLYSNLQHQDFLNHRLDLLIAADKYDISDLKDACEKSLIEDIDTKNVLERLHSASMYRLPKLKLSCIKYLVKFGKIFDIREEFDALMKYADRELVVEVVNEILSVWKGF